MSILELKYLFKDYLVFTKDDILKQIPDFNREQLFHWQNKGYIKKIRRGYYIFSDINLKEEELFSIANKIYSPSYISLESALSYYGLIPEGVYSVRSISTLKTINFDTPIGNYVYKTIKPQLYFGYKIEGNAIRRFTIAEPEKALLDFLYLNPHIQSENEFEGLRLNEESFKRLYTESNFTKFYEYLNLFENQVLKDRVRRLFYYLNPKWGSTFENKGKEFYA